MGAAPSSRARAAAADAAGRATSPPAPPAITWDPALDAYLASCFGADAWAVTKAALARPPPATCVRAAKVGEGGGQPSPSRPAPAAVDDEGGDAFAARLVAAAGPAEAGRFTVEAVDGLAGTVLIRARSQAGSTPPPRPPPPPPVGAVVVSRAAGEAVLLGAPAFAPGVLATTAGLGPGDAVELRAVTAVKGGPPGLTRGCVLPDGTAAAAVAPAFLGVGTLLQPRSALFAGPGSGPAVALTHPVHPAPSGQVWAPPGLAVIQHLASVAAATALGVKPGAVVLDCCAAPGAKATLLASALRGGPGVVVALDKSRPRVARLEALASETGVADVLVPVRADATRLWAGVGGGGAEVRPDPRRDGAAAAPSAKAVARIERKAKLAAACGQRLSVKAAADAAAAGVEVGGGAAPRRARRGEDGGPAATGEAAPGPPPAARDAAAFALAAPGRFTHVLLDAPCSGLGLRPRLAQPLTAADVGRAASYQRALVRQAVAALAPGGALLYSTCSLAPAENEAVVAAALATGLVDLVDAGPPGGDTPARLGGRGLVGRGPVVGGRDGQTEAWLPDDAAAAKVRRFWPGAACGREGGDTVGFFMAKFVRRE